MQVYIYCVCVCVKLYFMSIYIPVLRSIYMCMCSLKFLRVKYVWISTRVFASLKMLVATFRHPTVFFRLFFGSKQTQLRKKNPVSEKTRRNSIHIDFLQFLDITIDIRVVYLSRLFLFP